jgi:uncharacterized protein YdcH (DUF465 family)
MSYKQRILALTEAHRVLDKDIIEAEKNSNYSAEKISEMKKKKLALKDEIRRYEKLQWEYEHETVRFDD